MESKHKQTSGIRAARSLPRKRITAPRGKIPWPYTISSPKSPNRTLAPIPQKLTDVEVKQTNKSPIQRCSRTSQQRKQKHRKRSMNLTRAHPRTSNPDPKQDKRPFPTQPTKLGLSLKYHPSGTSVQVLIWTVHFNVQNGPRATSAEKCPAYF